MKDSLWILHTLNLHQTLSLFNDTQTGNAAGMNYSGLFRTSRLGKALFVPACLRDIFSQNYKCYLLKILSQ